MKKIVICGIPTKLLLGFQIFSFFDEKIKKRENLKTETRGKGSTYSYNMHKSTSPRFLDRAAAAEQSLGVHPTSTHSPYRGHFDSIFWWISYLGVYFHLEIGDEGGNAGLYLWCSKYIFYAKFCRKRAARSKQWKTPRGYNCGVQK